MRSYSVETEDRAMKEFMNAPTEHTYDEEWFWSVDDQDYRILIIHHDDCIACMMGVPIEEE